jgi:hypothetical protein
MKSCVESFLRACRPERRSQFRTDLIVSFILKSTESRGAVRLSFGPWVKTQWLFSSTRIRCIGLSPMFSAA